MVDEITELRKDVAKLLTAQAVSERHREHHELSIDTKFATLLQIIEETRADQRLYMEKLHGLPESLTSMKLMAEELREVRAKVERIEDKSRSNQEKIDRVDGWVQKIAWVVILGVVSSVLGLVLTKGL